MISRRNFVRWIGAAGALGALGVRPSSSFASTTNKPTYFLSIFLGGGMDQLLTTDPKRRSQIEPFVHRPYGDRDILATGGIELGPNLKWVSRHANRLTIINGVLTGTVSHQSGALMHARLKMAAEPEMPTIVDLIGAHHRAAVPSVTLGDTDDATYSSTWFGAGSSPSVAGLLDEIDGLTNDELLILAEEAERSAVALSGDPGLRSRMSVENIRASAKLFRRLAEIPRFVAEKWSNERAPQWYAASLQRTLWLFKHDLTRAVYLRTGRVYFDTHTNNTELQRSRCKELFEMLALFLDKVEQTTLDGAPATQRFAMLACSELGRFPRLNTNNGKDHIPETPVIMYGAGFRPGQFGDTGRQTEAFPVDLQSGRRKKGGHIVTLDDIGATVLELAGVDFARFGHSGMPLPFCLAK